MIVKIPELRPSIPAHRIAGAMRIASQKSASPRGVPGIQPDLHRINHVETLNFNPHFAGLSSISHWPISISYRFSVIKKRPSQNDLWAGKALLRSVFESLQKDQETIYKKKEGFL